MKKRKNRQRAAIIRLYKIILNGGWNVEISEIDRRFSHSRYTFRFDLPDEDAVPCPVELETF